MNKITHKCKNCGWERSITSSWGDVKPRMCANKQCLTSFLKYPEALHTQHPEKHAHEAKKEAPRPQPRQEYKPKPKKEESDE